MALLYVSTTGSDSNSGASGNPFKSISKAAGMAKPGDTVLVAGGTYTGLVSIWNDGAAGAPITFKPMDGQKVIIDGAGTPANSNLVTIGGDYVTFQGFEVKNATVDGIMSLNAHDVKIIGNKVHDTQRNAIYVQAQEGNTNSYNNVIEGNEVWYTNLKNKGGTASGGWGQAVSVLRSDNAVIKGNYVHDNWGEGIDVIVSRGAKVTDNIVRDNYSVQIFLDNASNATIQNNTIYHTYKTEFYRSNKPGVGIQIANETGGSSYIQSSGIKVIDNVMGGVGSPAYSNHGAGGGLHNSVLSPNTIHATPDPVIAANPNPAPSIPGSTPTPTPTPHRPAEPAPTNPTGLDLQGTASADTIKGGSLGDSIHGGNGNDVIYGNAGNDSLSGGEGGDTIYGGDGNDMLSGGNGSDLFVFSSSSVAAGGVDRITDFNPAADWIEVGLGFAALTNGALRADEFRLGARAADWNDRIIYNKATGEVFYDADGTGAGAQVKFAELTPNTALAHWNFYVW